MVVKGVQKNTKKPKTISLIFQHCFMCYYYTAKKCRVVLNLPSLSQFQLALFIETETTGGLKQPKFTYSVIPICLLGIYISLINALLGHYVTELEQ